MRVHNYSVYLDDEGCTFLVRDYPYQEGMYLQWCIGVNEYTLSLGGIEEFLSGEGTHLTPQRLSKLKLVCHVRSKNT